jgi:hypothetical protein
VAGIAIREGDIPEQVGVGAVIVGFGASQVEADFGAVAAAEEADVILEVLNVIRWRRDSGSCPG